MKIIPFDPSISSRQMFNVNLGEMVCNFDIHWNERAGAWFCDFITTTGSNYGMRLMENRPILCSLNATGLSGDFRVLKMNKMAKDYITYDNLGSDWNLVYASSGEWEDYDGL